MNNKKLLRLIFTTVIILATLTAVAIILTLPASAASYSGTCGENLQWELDTETGVLNITGTGEMYNYDAWSGITPPWYPYRQYIKTINCGDIITSIGDYAFMDCINLTDIIIPDSVTNMGRAIFYNLDDLTVYVQAETKPDGWDEDWHITMFGGYGDITCKVVWNFKEIYTDEQGLNFIISNDNTGEVLSYNGNASSVIIPEHINDIAIKNIGNRAFENCTNLENIEIPQSVTSIGYQTFCGCSNLINITIPDSIMNIGDGAFSGCTNIKFTELNSGKYLGNNNNPYVILMSLNDLTIPSFDIPENTKIIYDSAFADCSNLTSITIPDSVITIGSGAFDGCTSLTDIRIPDSVNKIGSAAFESCTSLNNITIPDSVTGISSYTFRNCSNLTNIIIPHSVTYISNEAFKNCSNLISIIISDNVTTPIGDDAFSGCKNLTIYTEYADASEPWWWTEESFEYFGICNPVFNNVEQYTDSHGLFFILLENETAILSKYRGEDSMVIIPESVNGRIVSKIDAHAFSNCLNLTNVTIPDSVTYIGQNAFLNCTNLTFSCHYNSTARTYAQNCDINYSIIKYEGPSAPSAPTIQSQTETSITLVPTDGYEYRLGDGEWQSNNIFDNLTVNTEYTFYQRIATTISHLESDTSEGANIKTLEHSWSADLICGENSHYYECINCGTTKDAEDHKFSSYLSNENDTHTATCICGMTHTDYCTGGDATCSNRAICDVCSGEHGATAPHNYANYSTNKDNTHTGICTECGMSNTQYCSGGIATCNGKAICEICLSAYGEYSPHKYLTQCSNETEHWQECVCGNKANVETHIYTSSNECDVCGHESPIVEESTTEETTTTQAPTKNDNISVGCSSSLGLGTIAIISLCSLGLISFRKKDE